MFGSVLGMFYRKMKTLLPVSYTHLHIGNDEGENAIDSQYVDDQYLMYVVKMPTNTAHTDAEMCIRDRVSGISLEGKDLLKIPSKRRNPILADIFSRLKCMERRGSGFKKILADYEGPVSYTHLKGSKKMYMIL